MWKLPYSLDALLKPLKSTFGGNAFSVYVISVPYD